MHDGNALDLSVLLPQLFHPEEDGLDGIREVNGMRLLLVGINEERQEVQFISEWGPMWGVENLLQPAQGLLVLLLSPDNLPPHGIQV